MDRLIILAIAIVIAGALSGGLYSISGTGNGMSMVINRFTGTVWNCTILDCHQLAKQISN